MNAAIDTSDIEFRAVLGPKSKASILEAVRDQIRESLAPTLAAADRTRFPPDAESIWIDTMAWHVIHRVLDAMQRNNAELQAIIGAEIANRAGKYLTDEDIQSLEDRCNAW